MLRSRTKRIDGPRHRRGRFFDLLACPGPYRSHRYTLRFTMSTTVTEMQVKQEQLNPCTVQFAVVCSSRQVQDGLDRAAKDFAKRIKVPGFRPGAAPRSVIEKMVDPNEYLNRAVDETVRHVLTKVVQDAGLTVQQGPSVQVTKFDKDGLSLEFVAKVPLPPVVNLGDYSSISVDVPAVEVSEDEVDQQIEDLRNRKGKTEQVTGRGIQEGDNAVVNIRTGDDEKGRTFMVIAGRTFPDLDQALIGMAVEQFKHVRLAFPSTFQEKDWAGTTHETIVTVRSVTTVAPPQLDDDFAQSLKAENLDELRTKVREGIRKAKAQIGKEMANEQILDSLLASSEVSVADNTWEQVGSRRLQEIAAELQRQGKTVEEHAKENNLTVDDLVAAQMMEAKVHVQRAVLIETIFRNEEMKIAQSDVDRHFLSIAQENQVPEDQLQRFAKEFGPQLREEIVFRAMYHQVMEFLNGKVTPGGAKPAKAPKAEAAVEAPKKAAKPKAKKSDA